MPDLAPTEIARALKMRRNVQTYRVISRDLRRPVSTIYRSIQRFRETGTYMRGAGQGRKRRTSSRGDRFIRLRVRRYPRLTAVQARHELETVRGVTISEPTDNARPHTARVTQAYLNDMNITVMEWPTRSPDMNPIEQVWDLLRRKVKTRIPAPANVGELRIAVVQEWRRLSQETIDNIILSMPRRVETLIRARGGNKRY
ncbi:jg26775 [Pararge aegeria aegeria]|uniref:Jg26775 protein n=1 Tax=Pararge aegeria aegeria TaxID=348720 RepID=A0A8S4QKI0_9NEOP|nr:jg26775 [Pararge aegeria aegeria]